jgi:cell division protease FtsH
MDGFSPASGIVAVAATNRPDILDPALLRAGRFERHVTVEKPDVDGRLAILQLHARGRRLVDPQQDLPIIARGTAGFTGADLANVLNESALLAVRARASGIMRVHLEEAAERVQSGPKRRGSIMTMEERQLISYHESGHAIVAAALGRSAEMHKLSIVARGQGVGHLALVQEDRIVHHRAEISDHIAIAMAGFAAEILVYGEPSTGSEQDLERATTSARDMAGRYGMSDRLGPVRILRESKEVFLGRDYVGTRDVSQPTLEHLDAEVRHILEEQRDLARSIVEANRPLLDELAAALLASETLQGPNLLHYLVKVRPVSSTHERVPVGVDGHQGS